MTAYIVRTGLERRFGVDEIEQLLDDDRNSAESSNEASSLARAIDDASNIIDGYLAGQYTLPLASVPSIVTAWAADVARYRLYDDAAPDEVRRRYDDAIASLKLVAQGIIKLPPGSDGAPVTTPASPDSYSADRVFTADSLKYF